jgi:hypothetical protein
VGAAVDGLRWDESEEVAAAANTAEAFLPVFELVVAAAVAVDDDDDEESLDLAEGSGAALLEERSGVGGTLIGEAKRDGEPRGVPKGTSSISVSMEARMERRLAMV